VARAPLGAGQRAPVWECGTQVPSGFKDASAHQAKRLGEPLFAAAVRYCLAIAAWKTCAGSSRWSWLSWPPSSSIHLIAPVKSFSPVA